MTNKEKIAERLITDAVQLTLNAPNRVEPVPRYNAIEQAILDKAATVGMKYTNHEITLAFAKLLIGDFHRLPWMWTMETESGARSHTHYQRVAEDYATRPGYTVTPIYPRVKK